MHEETVKKRPVQPEELDLLQVALYLLKRWYWFALAFLVGCGLALVIYHFTTVPSYKASAEIYITSSDTVINVQDIQLSAALTVDYEEILLSRQVLKKVIRSQDLDINYAALKSMISITNPEDSHCIRISVTAGSAGEAVDITNDLVLYGIDQIYRIVGKDEPSIIDSAEADAVEEIRASRTMYAAVGGVVGAAAVGAFFFLLFLLNTTLETEEDVENYLGLNVLAVVPEASGVRERGGHKNR